MRYDASPYYGHILMVSQGRRTGMPFPPSPGNDHVVRSGHPTYSDRVSPYSSSPSSATRGKSFDYRSPTPVTPVTPATPTTFNSDLGGFVQRIRKKSSSKALAKEAARIIHPSDPRSPQAQLGSALLNRANLFNETNAWP
jgi:hypothetical protein